MRRGGLVGDRLGADPLAFRLAGITTLRYDHPVTNYNYIVVPHVSSYIEFQLVYKLNPSLIKLYFRSYFYIW